MEKAPAASSSNTSRHRLTPVDTRVALVAMSPDQLSPEAQNAVFRVLAESSRHAAALRDIFQTTGVDTGRAIAAIDAVQAAKNTAVDAIMLPFAVPELKERAE